VRPRWLTGLLVALPLAGAAADLQPCLACHGKAGQSTLPLTPSLGGQPSFFVVSQLFLFREARRGDAAMVAVAKSMSDGDLRAYAEAVAQLPPPAAPAKGRDPARYARGEALAAQHKCNICHSADFSGQQQVPRLANQREDYLLKALREFKGGERKGYGGAMAVELMPVDPAGIADLAHFLAQFTPGSQR
jgi:cytochrome c553